MAPKGSMTLEVTKFKPLGDIQLIFDDAFSHLDENIITVAERNI